MNENRKVDLGKWIVLSLLILLFLYGFEYELNYFYNEKAKAVDYLIALSSCFLLLIYIIPMNFILFRFGEKLGVHKKFIITSLICGMFIPGFLAAYANDNGGLIIEKIFSKSFSDSWGLAFTAPLNEELIKLILVLLILYLLNSKGLKDFFICGFAVGLGFQIMEDISYIGSDGLLDIDNLFPMVLSRITGAWSSHWTYTALFSIGFYFILRKRKRSSGIFLLLFVFINHFLWDSPYGEYEYVPALLGASMLVCLVFVIKKYLKIDFDL